MLLRRNITLPSCLHGRSVLRQIPGALHVCTLDNARAGRSKQSSTLSRNSNDAYKTNAVELHPNAPLNQSDRDDVDRTQRPWEEVIANISSDPTQEENWRIAKLDNIPGQLDATTYEDIQLQLQESVHYNAEQDRYFEEDVNRYEDPSQELVSKKGYKHWWHAWEVFWVTKVRNFGDMGPQGEEIHDSYKSFARAFVFNLDAEQLREKWDRMSLRSRLTVTPMLLLGSLLCSPDEALFVLANTNYPWGDFRIRMRCLMHLNYTSLSKIGPDPLLKKRFKQELAKCYSPDTWTLEYMRPDNVELLLYWSSPDESDMIIRAIHERYPFERTRVFQEILKKHARLGDVDEFLKLLPKFPANFFRDCDHAMKEQLKHFLRRDTVVTSEMGTNFKILPELFKLGFEPDQDIYNIVLLNALTQNFYTVAWDLYRHLRDQDIEIWNRLYVKLLQAAMAERDYKALDQIMTDIHESERLSRNPVIIVYTMNIVRVVTFEKNEKSPWEAVTRIMALYDKRWDRQALQPYQILGSMVQPSHGQQLELPPPVAIAYTLWTYILVQRSEKIVNGLWQRITDLAQHRDWRIFEALQRDTVYNGFVLFYSRKLGTLLHALKVVQYMIDRDHCEPTARTWSLLVCGFLRHHQMDQAANIVRMMRARGMKLEHVAEEHMPHEYTLEDLKARVEVELDETQVPADVEISLSEPEEDEANQEADVEAEAAEDVEASGLDMHPKK